MRLLQQKLKFEEKIMERTEKLKQENLKEENLKEEIL
jgi:hypothetical protein